MMLSDPVRFRRTDHHRQSFLRRHAFLPQHFSIAERAKRPPEAPAAMQTIRAGNPAKRVRLEACQRDSITYRYTRLWMVSATAWAVFWPEKKAPASSWMMAMTSSCSR